MKREITIGIDPGLTATGFAVLASEDQNYFLIEAGEIKTSAKKTLETRLLMIYDNVVEICNKTNPSIMAMEELFTSYLNPKTAIIMAHARGAIMLAAAKAGIAVVGYPAKQVKQSITGSGSATKRQVQKMVQIHLNLPDSPILNHAADAIAIALCHSRHRPPFASLK